MKRRRHRPRLFLKGKSPNARRRLLAVFVLIFGAAVQPGPARAACVELAGPTSIATALGFARALGVADLDRDGDPDPVTVISGDLFWYSNDAASTFSRATIATALGATSGVAIADLDGDGDPDVAIGSTDHGAVFTYLNSGNGGSWTRETVVSTLVSVSHVVAADFDLDGDVDLMAAFVAPEVVCPPPGADPTRGGCTPLPELFTVKFFEDLGSFWSGDPLSTSATLATTGIALGDIDRDGDPDPVVARGTELSWFPNPRGASFWPRLTIAAVPSGTVPQALVDLDRDGDLDLFATVQSTNELLVFVNAGAGNGSTWSESAISTLAAGAAAGAVADVDHDGDLDALALSDTSNVLAWYENDGAGGGWTEHVISSAALGATPMAVADFDRDGDLDLLSASADRPEADWSRNDLRHGSALFGAARSISTIALAPRVLAVADVDRDGDLDPVFVNGATAGIDWYKNDGTGSSWIFGELTGFLEFGDDLDLVDLDFDGDLDFVAPSDYLAALLWFRNTGGGGTSNFFVDTSLTDPVSSAAGDFDGDGRPDLAVADKALDAVFWYRNDGTPATGTWTRLTVATAIDGVSKIVESDIDRDGDLDLLAIAPAVADRAILWLDNNGAATPTFTRRTIQTLANTPFQFAPADVDGDGDLDLWLLAGSELLWLESDATPASGAWTVHSAGTATKPGAIESADLDGDGDVDLAFTDDEASNGFQWLENDGAQQFTKHTLLSISAPRRLAAADLDRDGDLDFALATNNALVWLPNLGTRVHDDGFDSDGTTACWSSAVP